MPEQKPAKVSVERIETERSVYKLLGELIDEHHPHLEDADIVLCWKFGWRADLDGSVRIVQAAKASQVDRALRTDGTDFMIFLNHEVFNSGHFTEHEARYWIDHALECCKPKNDDEGEQKLDENGRPVWRMRRPTLQLFPEVYKRHGCVIPDMAKLRSMVLEREDQDKPLIAMIEAEAAKRDSILPEEPAGDGASEPEATGEPSANGHHATGKPNRRRKRQAAV